MDSQVTKEPLVIETINIDSSVVKGTKWTGTVLSKVTKRSDAERCGLTKYTGWRLQSINGVHIATKTTTSQVTALIRQAGLAFCFRNGEEFRSPFEI